MLLGRIAPAVQKALRMVFSDTALTETVQYKRFDSQEFSKFLGHPVTSYTTFPLLAARLKHNSESVLAVATEVEVGDVLFLFKAAGFPTSTSLKDQIVDSVGAVFKIKGIDPVFDFIVGVSVEGG